MSAKTITWNDFEEAEHAVVTHANSQLLRWLQPNQIGGFDHGEFDETIEVVESTEQKPEKSPLKQAHRKNRAHRSG